MQYTIILFRVFFPRFSDRSFRKKVKLLIFSFPYLQDPEAAKADEDGTALKGKVVKFGWLDGVYVSAT